MAGARKAPGRHIHARVLPAPFVDVSLVCCPYITVQDCISLCDPDGMEIARGTGFLGIQITNGVFKLTAYDAKKKPVAADFTRVALRWQPTNVKSPERTLLVPSGGVGVFSSDKIVKPPHQFRLFVTLIKGDGDDAPVENFTVEFKA